MAIDIQQFPKWIYHTVHPAKIVNSQQELDLHLDQGWRTERLNAFSEQAIREKVTYHTQELEKWMKALEAYQTAPPEKEEVKEEKEEPIITSEEKAAEPASPDNWPPAPEQPAEGTSELLTGDIDIGKRDGVKLIAQPGTPVMIAKPLNRPKPVPLKDRMATKATK